MLARCRARQGRQFCKRYTTPGTRLCGKNNATRIIMPQITAPLSPPAQEIVAPIFLPIRPFICLPARHKNVLHPDFASVQNFNHGQDCFAWWKQHAGNATWPSLLQQVMCCKYSDRLRFLTHAYDWCRSWTLHGCFRNALPETFAHYQQHKRFEEWIKKGHPGGPQDQLVYKALAMQEDISLAEHTDQAFLRVVQNLQWIRAQLIEGIQYIQDSQPCAHLLFFSCFEIFRPSTFQKWGVFADMKRQPGMSVELCVFLAACLRLFCAHPALMPREDMTRPHFDFLNLFDWNQQRSKQNCLPVCLSVLEWCEWWVLVGSKRGYNSYRTKDRAIIQHTWTQYVLQKRDCVFNLLHSFLPRDVVVFVVFPFVGV